MCSSDLPLVSPGREERGDYHFTVSPVKFVTNDFQVSARRSKLATRPFELAGVGKKSGDGDFRVEQPNKMVRDDPG